MREVREGEMIRCMGCALCEHRERDISENVVSKQKIYQAVQTGRDTMKRIKLSRGEQEIEQALLRGEYVDVGRSEFEAIAEALTQRRKDTVLDIRVNSQDLKAIKEKARRYGIKYQTFISEFLHRVAHS